MRHISRIRSIVDRLFKKHLFVTNISVGIVFLGAGDVIQQSIEKRLYPGKKYEKERTGTLLLAGSTLGGLEHFWYKFLDTKFPLQTPSHVGKKLLAEMVMGPVVILAFFLWTGQLYGKCFKNSFEDFKKNASVILFADWAIYIPFQAINFFYVPARYRVLYVCTLYLVYDVFLSYILHKEDNKKLQLESCNEREKKKASCD